GRSDTSRRSSGRPTRQPARSRPCNRPMWRRQRPRGAGGVGPDARRRRARRLAGLGHGGALAGQEAVFFVLNALELADVDEEALSEAGLAVRAGDDPRVPAGPDDPAVPPQHAVLALEGHALLGRAGKLAEDAVAIVGMEDPFEQLAVPLLGGGAGGGL